jgi:hypothetical protein
MPSSVDEERGADRRAHWSRSGRPRQALVSSTAICGTTLQSRLACACSKEQDCFPGLLHDPVCPALSRR